MQAWQKVVSAIILVVIFWLVWLVVKPKVATTPTGGITVPDHPATQPAPAPTTPESPGPTVATGTVAPAIVPVQVPIKRIVVTKTATTTDPGEKTLQLGELYVYSDGQLLKRQDFSDAKFIDGSTGKLWNVYTPWNLLDDDLKTFAHSEGPGSLQALELVLAAPRNVQKIEVFNRQDCCQNRLAGAVLELYDATGNKVWSQVLTQEMQQTLVR